jgi:hypothetical protein
MSSDEILRRVPPEQRAAVADSLERLGALIALYGGGSGTGFDDLWNAIDPIDHDEARHLPLTAVIAPDILASPRPASTCGTAPPDTSASSRARTATSSTRR